MEMYTYISKCCRNPTILQYIRRIVSNSYQGIPKNGLVKFYGETVFKKQAMNNSLKIRNFLGGSTVVSRLNSNISNKNKKVGYWLRTHKGKVFAGFVLSVIVGYYVIFIGICTVLDEVIKKTIK